MSTRKNLSANVLAVGNNHKVRPVGARFDDWLGKGIYFWEHGYQRALEFAEWKHSKNEIDEPTVLGAYIHLGRCFDLTDTWATSLLGVHHGRLGKSLQARGEPMPVNRKADSQDFDLVLRELDCAVLNIALDDPGQSAHIQTVRGVFVEGAPVYPGAQIYEKTHIQIAVRDVSCVLGYFLPFAPYT